jgi:hypothetical protein
MMIRAPLAAVAAAVLCAAVVWAAPLGAQEATGAPGVVAPAPATDSVAPLDRMDGGQLRAGAATFRLTLVRDVGPTALGTRTVEVSEASLGGTPTWLFVERRIGTAVPTLDSLWLSRTDLRPLRWAAAVDRTQLAASFARDSVFGAVQSYAGRFSFSAGVLPGVLVTPAMAEKIVELLPLRVGYRAGASLLLIDTGTPRALPAEVTVEREERIRTAAGDVDCWLVLLRAGAMEERLWVEKSRRAVVRTEQGSAVGRVVADLL